MILSFVAILIGIILFPRQVYAAIPPETGGTNFVVYDLAEYGSTPIESNWKQIKFVIPHFNNNPDLVRQKLSEMCESGQRKVALVLWFMPYSEDGLWIVDSTNSKPTELINQNITSLVSMIRLMKKDANTTCFNELQFRFALMGAAAPGGWTEWKESEYVRNKTFIWETRNIVKNNAGNLKVLFDLGLEQGGLPYGQNQEYIRRLWKDYTDQFGVEDSYGFSISWDKGRLLSLVSDYDKVGRRPSQYAIDMYDNPDSKTASTYLSEVALEMQQTLQSEKSIIIQETYYNDSIFYSAAQSEISKGLNIRFIMQWQLERSNFLRSDGGGRHFSTLETQYSYHGLDFLPTILPDKPGDLNGDNLVNVFDFNILATNYGSPYTETDYLILKSNFGK